MNKIFPVLVLAASLLIIIVAIEVHSRGKARSQQTAGIFSFLQNKKKNVAPKPSLKTKLLQTGLATTLDIAIPTLNKKAPAILSKIVQTTLKPLNLPKLIDPGGNGINLPIPSPYNTMVDVWIDNPLGAIDTVLGPILKAIGLNGAQLQNVLPAAGSCAGCFKSSPIHLFVNNLKITDIKGLDALKILGHSLEEPSTLKMVLGVSKDTDVKVTLSGSLDLKHKCNGCIFSDGPWKLITSASDIAVTLTLKKGEFATLCASYDLSSAIPIVVHSIAPSNTAQKPVLKISSLSLGKGNSQNALGALSGILKLFGSSEEKLVNKIAATVTGPLLKAALDAGKNEINSVIKDNMKSFCAKPPKAAAFLVKHLPTCKAQGNPAKPPGPNACTASK